MDDDSSARGVPWAKRSWTFGHEIIPRSSFATFCISTLHDEARGGFSRDMASKGGDRRGTEAGRRLSPHYLVV